MGFERMVSPQYGTPTVLPMRMNPAMINYFAPGYAYDPSRDVVRQIVDAEPTEIVELQQHLIAKQTVTGSLGGA